ncbi:MAG: hypothetical protein R3C20_10600 [Planctomycetaceae bacterium]
MKRFTKSIIVAASVALVAASTSSAMAGCHGRSGGYSVGRSYSHSYSPSYVSSYNHYSHSQPSYPYSQPVYSQPQPVYTPSQQVISQSTLPPVSGIQQLPQVQPQQQPQLLPTQPQPQTQSVQVAQAGLAQQQAVAPTQQQVVAPTQQTVVNTPPSQSTVASAEMSALQALGGFAPPAPQTTNSPTSTVPVHVGVWTASIGNNATVQLSLQADGSFEWIATNGSGGKSSFQGSFAVENGTLSLIRQSDNQKLAGSMTLSGNDSFSFKLSATNAAALEFKRG